MFAVSERSESIRRTPIRVPAYHHTRSFQPGIQSDTNTARATARRAAKNKGGQIKDGKPKMPRPTDADRDAKTSHIIAHCSPDPPKPDKRRRLQVYKPATQKPRTHFLHCGKNDALKRKFPYRDVPVSRSSSLGQICASRPNPRSSRHQNTEIKYIETRESGLHARPSRTGLSSLSSLLKISDLSTGLIESSSSSLGCDSELLEWPAFPQPLTRICLCGSG